MTYRNPKLLQLAKEVPHCMYPNCGHVNQGDVVACHSNSLQHGKGRGLKAHDIPAYLCPEHHDILDGRKNPGLAEMTKKDKELMFYDAMYQSVLWLLESGHIHVSNGKCKCGEAA